MSWLRVKICCISSLDEARLAIEAGADALGLVSEMPSGPGVIDEHVIAEIVASVPTTVDTFLLTSKTDPVDIQIQVEQSGANTIQLVDWLGIESLQELRDRCPNTRLVQVIHIESAAQIQMALDIESDVDALLLDSGKPYASRRELGGTGRIHDWSISEQICQAVSVPVFLAGGLNETNIREAIRSVNPYGVDLCSSVRTNGSLDVRKIAVFFETVSPFRADRPLEP
ncbi:MAG: phosphoribosylanthranilate isomerase [Rhodothermia bacterium]|nr:MAG: phosphoribosylanthranilate isomerase [Rhodothermia bacterium]